MSLRLGLVRMNAVSLAIFPIPGGDLGYGVGQTRATVVCLAIALGLLLLLIYRELYHRRRWRTLGAGPAEALRQSEATNRALISAVPDLLIWIDHQGNHLDALGSSQSLKLNRPLEQLIGVNVVDVLPRDEAQRRMHYIERALATNELQVYEYQLEIDGDLRDEEARIVVCGDQQVLCMVRDITNRKQVERDLQQKEDFLQLVLDTIPEQIFWKSRESVYLGCNRLFADTAGLATTDDIIGKTDDDLPWFSGQADGFRQEDQAILSTGQPLLHNIEQKLRSNGDLFWARVNKVVIPDAQGRPIGLLGTLEDITERIQAEESRRSRNQKLSTLHRISEITLTSQATRAVYQSIAEEISAATGFPMVAIELYHPDRQVMVFEGVTGVAAGDGEVEVPVDQTLSGKVAQSGQAIIRHFYGDELKRCATHPKLSGLNVQTFICMPMTVHQSTVGVLSLAHPDIMQIDDDTQRWVESLANYLALITHRKQLEASVRQANADLEQKVAEQTSELQEAIAQLQQEILQRHHTEAALQDAHAKLTHWVSDLEQRHLEITLLNDMSDLMQACITVEEAYRVVAQFMPRLFLDCSGAVYLIDQAKHLVEAVATWGDASASQTLFAPHECCALRRGQPHYVPDTANGLCCQHLLEPPPTHYFCVPMAAQGETSGVLYLSLPPPPLTQAKQQLATTVARQIALAIANLKLYATLQNQSIRDPLTGLFNRRYLGEFLDRELHRAQRNQQSLSLLLLDVDHFKQFNDTFGHDAGDAVLRSLSRFLQASVRNSDIACRYGGEEMVLVLPDTDPNDATQRAEQLRQGMQKMVIDYPHPLGSITVSIGVACFPTHGRSSGSLLHAADQALYQAKAAGRDRVMRAKPEV